MRRSGWRCCPDCLKFLVYLCDGDVPFFRVSFLPILPRARYQKKAIFLKPVVKNMSKEKKGNRVVFQSNFCVLEYAFDLLFPESVSFEGKNSGAA